MESTTNNIYDTYIDFRKLIRDIEEIYNYKIQNMELIAGVIAMINHANREFPDDKKCITFAYNIILYCWDNGTWRLINHYMINDIIDAYNISQTVNDLVILASILDFYIELVSIKLFLNKVVLKSSGNINIMISGIINELTDHLNLFTNYNIKSLCVSPAFQEIKDNLDDLPFDIILYDRFA